MVMAMGTLVACADPDHALQPVDFDSDSLYLELEPLGRSIGDSRIVLLGENGHGVGDFTSAKVKLIEWLHREHGFDVVVFESGFFECGHVWRRLDSLSSRDALYQCLRYPLQHAELLPLFDYIRATRDSDRPLVMAGMDVQAQGYDSDPRPTALHRVLDSLDTTLAVRVAAVDSGLFLVAAHGGLGDSLYRWAYEHQDEASALYDSAAAMTDGWDRWVFRVATGWVDRLAIRGEAESAGTDRPVRYYEVRDEWMAEAVSALADSINGERKVVVWLHNDHARYGNFGDGAIRSAGGFLRERYGEDVFSLGLFMGSGTIADNGRNERTIEEVETGGVEDFLRVDGATASYIVLRDNTDRTMRPWSDSSRAYLRMVTTPMTLVPAAEFDALLYLDQVQPPGYDIR